MSHYLVQLYVLTVCLNLVFVYYDDLFGRVNPDPAAKSDTAYSVFMLLLCLTGPAAIMIYAYFVSRATSVNIDKISGDDNNA
jgi:hypothetical protein